MGTSLVIVESPAKARTIEGYLGSGYAVGSSVGHVRDLPDRAKDVPEAQRKRFGALGVDVDDGFEPYYVVDPGKKKIIADLKKRLADADELLLATDEDREGEAIAWHVAEAANVPAAKTHRVTFNEITEGAIREAFASPRDIDQNLDPRQVRRQSTQVASPNPGRPRSAAPRRHLLLGRLRCSGGLLEVLQAELELVGVELLRAPAEPPTL